ncbi:MAG TPA: zinc-dependent peptidase [Chitinophagaceae bacterium]|jgi:MtfA peptidase|nr:zinc-dependent peptidase [Chitinophagaceae bacterium]
MELVFICITVFFTIALFSILQNPFATFIQRYQYKKFLKVEDYYRNMVSSHLAYFRRLSEKNQHRLLFRTYLIHRAKKFHYVGVEKKEEMPVLISAVSAQLTLGLERFSLNYFRDIFVLQHDYHYGYYSLPFMGHVDNTGIYLSWDNFLKGIHRADENSNVGLHEMAHALAYVNFVVKSEEDKHFKKEFKNFSQVARPVFQEMQKGKKNFLGEYASTNYHEFWAVSVEMFFENPFRYKYELPELYDAMVKLLKQDPYEMIVNRNNPVIA